MFEEIIRERVGFGAAWLDDRLPDWAQRINIDTLNMEDRNLCLIGQLGKDYDKTVEDLGFSHTPFMPTSTIRCGLDFLTLSAQDWEGLTREWIKAIRERRNG